MGAIFSAIGSFFGSIIDVITNFIDFISTCINGCSELLSVIPSYVSAAFISAVTFSIIVACKRAILG